MYIVPQTIVKLYKGIPFNSTYKHTILFNSISQQSAYFNSKLAYTFSNFTYVRQEGVIRIPVCADNVFDCNYISFLNVGFGNKVFYAFITDVEYINNDTASISFVIDVFQTWHFDYNINKCMVEREHVADDTIGLHTVPENLDTGEYTIVDIQEEVSSRLALALYTISDKVGGSYTTVWHTVGNVVSPLLTHAEYVSEETGWGGIGDLFDTIYGDHPDMIAWFGMIPEIFVNPDASLKEDTRDFNVERKNQAFGSCCTSETYTPVNNKLYCYPYCLFTMDNYNGDVQQFQWEDFPNANTAGFAIHGTPIPLPCMECYPTNYKTTLNGIDVSAEQFNMLFENFPQVPYTIDSFKIWSNSQFKKQIASALSGVPISVQDTSAQSSTLSSVGSGIDTVMSSSVSSYSRQSTRALINPSQSLANFYNLYVDYQSHKIYGTSLGGSVQSCGVNASNGHIGFRFIQYQIKAEYAKIIDEFFTRFGYKVNLYKVPELNSRPYFNYVKTVDCNPTGNCPDEVLKAIASIFNSGITLWHTTNVGNYNVDNSITEGV